MENGKRHYHQRRIPGAALEKSRERLLAELTALRGAKTFDELFKLVNTLIRPIPGIGELAVYDTALRIGACFKLEPEKVYVHAGTREGARALGFDGCDVIERNRAPETDPSSQWTRSRRSPLPQEGRVRTYVAMLLTRRHEHASLMANIEDLLPPDVRRALTDLVAARQPAVTDDVGEDLQEHVEDRTDGEGREKHERHPASPSQKNHELGIVRSSVDTASRAPASM